MYVLCRNALCEALGKYPTRDFFVPIPIAFEDLKQAWSETAHWHLSYIVWIIRGCCLGSCVGIPLEPNRVHEWVLNMNFMLYQVSIIMISNTKETLLHLFRVSNNKFVLAIVRYVLFYHPFGCDRPDLQAELVWGRDLYMQVLQKRIGQGRLTRQLGVIRNYSKHLGNLGVEITSFRFQLRNSPNISEPTT